MPPTAPLIVKLSKAGGADASDAGGRNSSHVRYVATHGAKEANAAHLAYQATHNALPDEGQRLIGNAAEAGEAAAMAEARANDGHQWRWVVSLRGDEADRMGYDTAKWHALAREIAPRLAAAAGIRPQAVRWVAAHHDPVPAVGHDRHPHLHIAVWSAKPLDRPHMLSKDELRQAKRGVAQAVYGPERAALAKEKTALRETLRQAGAKTLKDALDVARQMRGQLPAGPQAELQNRLAALAAQMPGTGRAALAYMPPPVKVAARELADWLLQQPAMQQDLAAFQQKARDQAAYYTKDPTKLEGAALNATNDLRDRIAQAAVRTAAQLQRHQLHEQATAKQRLKGAAQSVVRAATRFLQEPPRIARRRPDRQRSRDDGRGRDH